MSDDRPGTTAVAERKGSVPSLDPRLRARRIEVRRSEGRRRLRRLLVLVAITVLAVGAWGLTRSPLLDVDHLEVVGVDRLDPAEVIGAGGIGSGDPLVDLDVGGARRSVEALPWVESVDVHRSWGGTIRYEVTERRPVAVAGGGESFWLIDSDGWVVGAATTADRTALTRVEGLEVPEPGARLDGSGRRVVDLVGSFTEGLLPWVDAVVVGSDDELTLRLWRSASDPTPDHDPMLDPHDPLAGGADDPAVILLGVVLDLPGQIVAAETVLTRVDLSCLAVIDARVASAPTVTRDPGCESAGAAPPESVNPT